MEPRPNIQAALMRQAQMLRQQRDEARALVDELRAENAQLRAELSACIAGGNDYAGDILADDEAGMMLAAGQGG